VEGLVKITDFGISHASGDVTLTQTGQITGTPAFLGPEVAQGREMTEASDVFSLGATLYTCIEGQPPFGMEENALAMLHRVAGGEILPPRRAGSLSAPLMRMLAADPADRPTMTQVRDELAKLAAGRDGDPTDVLLGRTDVGSSTPGRARTAAFPADDPEAAVTPMPVPPPPPPASPPTRTDTRERETAEPARAPVATPAPPTTPPPGREDTAPPGRRRGRALWVVAGLLAAVLAGLVVFWVVTSDGSPPNQDASSASTGAAPSSEQTDQQAEPESSPGTEEPTAPAAASASASTPTPAPAPAEDPAQAVTDFFSLLPGDLAAAHQLTSPGFQSEFPLSRFSGFWDDFSSVEIGNVSAEDDTTALVDITYVRPDGSSETERHRITFVPGEDGRLLLDSDAIA